MSDGADTGYPGRGWATFRDDWGSRTNVVRLLAVGAVSARRAYALPLAAAWDELLPLLNEAEERKLPRDSDLWTRLCDALSRTIDEAELDAEYAFADALIALLITAGIFGVKARDQAQRDQRRSRGARGERRRAGRSS
ncbi:MAG: hypothetical protein ACRDL2_15910 [Gaiellaceae bacterium]